jgi:hypothetical protein
MSYDKTSGLSKPPEWAHRGGACGLAEAAGAFLYRFWRLRNGPWMLQRLRAAISFPLFSNMKARIEDLELSQLSHIL